MRCNENGLSSPWFVILLFVGLAFCSCSAFAATKDKAQSFVLSDETIVVLQDGKICLPTHVTRITPHGVMEDLTDAGMAAMQCAPGEPGTWIYSGATSLGTATVIVTHEQSTSLCKPDGLVGPILHPDKHPVDIRPSKDSMASEARFGFSVMKDGAPVKTPVRYRASRFGRLPDTPGGSALKVSDRETMMGKGRVYIDEPGIWWITAEIPTKSGEPVLASLTFTIEDRPGPDQYAAFTKEGAYLDSPDAIAAKLGDAEVIFVGENHNDPVAHHLEHEILAAVHRAKGKVALSLEMFECDVQPVLDGYLAGLFTESHFLKSSRPWPRYDSDYRPMVEYAKENGLPVIAANAPRRIVNLVSRKGPEALKELPEGELRWIPSVDYHIPTEGRYVEKLDNLFASFGKPDGTPALPGPRHKRDWLAKGCPDLSGYNELLLKKEDSGSKMPGGMPPGMMMHAQKSKGNPSQSLWDATMAHSIAAFLEKSPETTVVQVNGSFHSNEALGTVEQLLRYRPETRVAVISILPDPAFPAFDKEPLAVLGDVIIITDPAWQPEE